MFDNLNTGTNRKYKESETLIVTLCKDFATGAVHAPGSYGNLLHILKLSDVHIKYNQVMGE